MESEGLGGRTGSGGAFVKPSVPEAADEPAVALFGAIPEVRSGEWRLLSARLLEERKHFRKRFLVFEITYRDGERERSAQVLVKVYRTDRASGAYMALRDLWGAGFRAPARSRVPRPYGYLAGGRELVQENVAGTPWADFLYREPGSLAKASAQAAEWLALLHQSDVPAETTGATRDVRETRRQFAELERAFPRKSEKLGPLVERLGVRLAEENVEPVPSHGDFNPENVLVADGHTVAVDLDHFGRREPAFDVGYALAQLLIMSRFRLGTMAPGSAGAAAFFRRYEQDRAIQWFGVAAHVARTFLQSLHYELVTLHNGRTWLLEEWPDLMEYWLESDGPHALTGPLHSR